MLPLFVLDILLVVLDILLLVLGIRECTNILTRIRRSYRHMSVLYALNLALFSTVNDINKWTYVRQNATFI